VKGRNTEMFPGPNQVGRDYQCCPRTNQLPKMSFPSFSSKQRLSFLENDHNIVEAYEPADFDEEYTCTINIHVRKREMKEGNVPSHKTEYPMEIWEKVFAEERSKFDALLCEYVSSKIEQGYTIIESLLDLYKKGIIPKGMVKKKANLNEYEFIIALSKNGMECSLGISDEEMETIKVLKDRLK